MLVFVAPGRVRARNRRTATHPRESPGHSHRRCPFRRAWSLRPRTPRLVASFPVHSRYSLFLHRPRRPASFVWGASAGSTYGGKDSKRKRVFGVFDIGIEQRGHSPGIQLRHSLGSGPLCPACPAEPEPKSTNRTLLLRVSRYLRRFFRRSWGIRGRCLRRQYKFLDPAKQDTELPLCFPTADYSPRNWGVMSSLGRMP